MCYMFARNKELIHYTLIIFSIKLNEARIVKDISRRIRSISRENGLAQISGFCLL